MHLFAITALSLLFALVCVHGGARVGLVDHPDARKQHQGSVPLTGGAAIFLTLLTGTAVLGIEPFTAQMLVIAGAVFLVGLFDDLRHIDPWLRLGIQYAAGIALATYGGIAIHNVGDLLAVGAIPLALLTVPLTALAVAGLSNAYNMIDGIDGLAASLLALPLLVLLALALKAGHPMAPAVALMLLPIGVFLLFNLGPNTRWWPKMFLGDAGSITLGFLVTAALVYFSQGGNALIRPVTALWLVSVPLMDMLATMGRRLRLRRPLMEADRSHLHHALMDRGLSARQALLCMALYAALAAGLGLALEQIPEYFSMALYFLLFFGHCGFVLRADNRAPEAHLTT
ncbi:undecaprenyl-phosphate alpha-N-acetylglucosaminyl 1-phosphate transferase [Mangrovimicrobium sediminis]|uniref:Undecaprenyl-phosphate alpha-N-acetylglucosaminyl 1-phosphate transferase n=1 Tax=Mangrovimicrobium sediminis TaxID=2562682 RepID=A0A4Z0M0I7_9GAMM|nr:undecaprenyl-phosphate alpha-N-acetylglucosaminyl 1-phosphate transferase [Haliea sp. SAOS-164]TGD73122.1 undecaprenyl-phosphate alpha-N-acetylglucosaminyl 1-phosphate transferase [Haliea sp. SAOS-164]